MSARFQHLIAFGAPTALCESGPHKVAIDYSGPGESYRFRCGAETLEISVADNDTAQPSEFRHSFDPMRHHIIITFRHENCAHESVHTPGVEAVGSVIACGARKLSFMLYSV